MRRTAILFVWFGLVSTSLAHAWVGSEPSFPGDMRLTESGWSSTFTPDWVGGTWCADGHCAQFYSNWGVAAAMRDYTCLANGITDYDYYNNLNGHGISCHECGADSWAVVDQRYLFCTAVNAGSGLLEFIPAVEGDDSYWRGVFVYVSLGVVLGGVFIRSVHSGACL